MLSLVTVRLLRYLADHSWPAILWTAAILVVCLMPSADVPGSHIELPGLDKVVHFGLFAVWGFLWTGWKGSKRNTVIVFGAALGLSIEFLQEFSSMGRSFEWWDFIADLAGIVVGCLLREKLIPAIFREAPSSKLS